MIRYTKQPQTVLLPGMDRMPAIYMYIPKQAILHLMLRLFLLMRVAVAVTVIFVAR